MMAEGSTPAFVEACSSNEREPGSSFSSIVCASAVAAGCKNCSASVNDFARQTLCNLGQHRLRRTLHIFSSVQQASSGI